MSSTNEGKSTVGNKIDGTATAKAVNEELAEQVKKLKETTGKLPCLAVVLVGERKDSQSYVKNKTKACKDVGIDAIQQNYPDTITEAKLLEVVTTLNKDEKVNGILVQLPLPAHIDADKIIAAIDPVKDADGLTDSNAGQVAKLGMQAGLISCTPLGCMELLQRYKVPVEGKHAVVIGRSNLVGKPMSFLLLSRNATVTICHSKTKDLPAVVKSADIVVAAIGKAQFVKGDWIKPGAVVLDVGINSLPDKTKASGYRLVGDVDYESASKVASLITPVPGGAGPMTVAMLLRNTVRAFMTQNGVKPQAAAKPALSLTEHTGSSVPE